MIPDHPYRPMIDEVATRRGIPADLFEAMIMVESNFNPNARSASDALGLGQIIYRIHKPYVDKMGWDLYGLPENESALFHPALNLEYSAAHLVYCYVSDGSQSWERGVRKYHSGSADPSDDFVDGQGTSSDAHIDKLRIALARVRTDRQGEAPVAVKFEKRIATNRIDDFDTLQSTTAWFTIHENGNSASSPYDEAKFVTNGGGTASVMYHFAVGVEDGQPTIVQIFPVNKRGKHAGNTTGNATSAAVETCQAPPGATSEQTQEALRELLYMLYTGDSRIEGIEGFTFSPDRTRGHKDWPGANPNCPRDMKAKWGGVEPVVEAVRSRLADGGGGGQPEPFALAPKLFGEVKGYKFNANGVVSKLWLATGEQTGRFPRLVEVLISGTTKWFVFSDGSVIVAEGAKVSLLQTLTVG